MLAQIPNCRGHSHEVWHSEFLVPAVSSCCRPGKNGLPILTALGLLLNGPETIFKNLRFPWILGKLKQSKSKYLLFDGTPKLQTDMGRHPGPGKSVNDPGPGTAGGVWHTTGISAGVCRWIRAQAGIQQAPLDVLRQKHLGCAGGWAIPLGGMPGKLE